jgi:hypothetical protein
MSTHDDTPLTARFAAMAPEPLASDWDDVLGRAGASPDRFRRRDREQPRRRRLMVALAATVLIAGFTASALALRAFVLDKGFVGLPPVGATPSTPEDGELVLHWMVRAVTLGGLQSRAWVYADGRIVWSRHDGPLPEGANEFTSGYLEQRLTPEGVELLRSQLVASGLFDRSRKLVVPDEHGRSLGIGEVHGSAWGSVEVHDGDEPVRLEWYEGDLAPPDWGESAAAATPEQLSALLAIDPLLAIEPSVLPATAWADRSIRAYVPSHYAACVGAWTPKADRTPTDESSLLSLLPSRAENLLRAKSRTMSVNEEGDVVSVSVCSKLTTDEARELAETLSGQLGPGLTKWGLTYSLAEPVIDVLAPSLSIEPYLPHGQTQDLGGG